MERRKYRIDRLDEKLMEFGLRREAVEVLMMKARREGRIAAEEIIGEMLREGFSIDIVRRFFLELGVDEACIAEAISLAHHPGREIKPVKMWPSSKKAVDLSVLGKIEERKEKEEEKLRRARDILFGKLK